MDEYGILRNWVPVLASASLVALALLVVTHLLFAYLYQQLSADGRCMPEDLLQNTILQGRNEMGNFTITDSDGVTRTLYDELDSGKTILLDLFFTT